MASRVAKRQKAPRAFTDDRAFYEQIVRRGLKSILSNNDLNPKKVANLLGIKTRTVVNMRTGHRKISAADIFIIAKALEVDPAGLIDEIIRRNKQTLERRSREDKS